MSTNCTVTSTEKYELIFSIRGHCAQNVGELDPKQGTRTPKLDLGHHNTFIQYIVRKGVYDMSPYKLHQFREVLQYYDPDSVSDSTNDRLILSPDQLDYNSYEHSVVRNFTTTSGYLHVESYWTIPPNWFPLYHVTQNSFATLADQSTINRCWFADKYQEALNIIYGSYGATSSTASADQYPKLLQTQFISLNRKRMFNHSRTPSKTCPIKYNYSLPLASMTGHIHDQCEESRQRRILFQAPRLYVCRGPVNLNDRKRLWYIRPSTGPWRPNEELAFDECTRRPGAWGLLRHNRNQNARRDDALHEARV